ncbi:hypothetical protein [Paraburkholderia kururiensis]|uniref:Uncharacterized protein n=1 Tax=Paraburkholderia kururiensis TaxID=984307 RepID=A0ABZ0WN90_9BURK|nr:hypothetical protein [Paraburkholderia kururiensis]WQD78854.1 hypothetical protein U0042_03860 [Paraburkholderia kururiensis]
MKPTQPVPAPSRLPSDGMFATGSGSGHAGSHTAGEPAAHPRDDNKPPPRSEPEPPSRDPLPDLPDPTEVGEDG